MSAENLTPKPEDKKELTEQTKQKFIELIEFVVAGGKQHKTLEGALDAAFENLPGGYTVIAEVDSPQNVAEFGWPSHQVKYFCSDEKDGKRIGKKFELKEGKITITPYIDEWNDEEMDIRHRALIGQASEEEVEQVDRIRQTEKLTDQLATYDASESDIADLNKILESLKDKRPAGRPEKGEGI
jgi:hypothetical protein